MGLVLAVCVHAADVQDRQGARLLAGTVPAGSLPGLHRAWADQRYTGALEAWLQTTRGWQLEVVRHAARQLARYDLAERPPPISSAFAALERGSSSLTGASIRGWAALRAGLRAADLFYRMNTMASQTLGSLELAALLAVARLGTDAYGLALRRDLAARTGRDYSVGALYTTLQRLEDKGFLTSHATDPLPVRGGRSRRCFTLTGAGARALRDAERYAASIWAGVGTTVRPEPA